MRVQSCFLLIWTYCFFAVLVDVAVVVAEAPSLLNDPMNTSKRCWKFGLLDILTFMSSQTKQSFFQNGIFFIPQSQTKTQPALLVRDP